MALFNYTTIFITTLILGFAYPMPPTKLNLVQKDLVNDELKSLSDQVDVAIPLKIQTREDLISWVTYAMRIMASKINITLGDTNRTDSKNTPEKRLNESLTTLENEIPTREKQDSIDVRTNLKELRKESASSKVPKRQEEVPAAKVVRA